MEDYLQHDPRTKQQIKDMLYAFLYGPIQKQFKKQLDAIIIKNAVLSQASHASFTYKGIVYSCDPGPPPRKMTRLVPQLQPLMEDYLKELRQLNSQELPYVLGFITQVLNASNNLHDYLKVFPEAIHQPIDAYIASCPCRTKHLTDFDVDCMQKKNAATIVMIKQRMTTNLLI